MHILVTGGCGFVGSNLVAALLDSSYKVTVVDTMWFGNYLEGHPNLRIICEDIRNIDQIPMDGIDSIIHLANISNDPCGELNAKLSWEVNALATMQLVEKAIRSSVKQFIYASSGSVYGVKEELQVTEDLSLIPISDYNKTKMISERVLLSYKDDINIQCIRPATICGFSPRMRLDLSVNMLTMQALMNKKITVFGGQQTRPNLHIKDMIRIYLHFLEHGDKFTGIFNAGFENLSIMEIAERVTQFVPAEIVLTESSDPRSYRLNSDKLKNTGFKPAFGIDNGIEDVIQAVESGVLKDEDQHYNLRVMKTIDGLS